MLRQKTIRFLRGKSIVVFHCLLHVGDFCNLYSSISVPAELQTQAVSQLWRWQTVLWQWEVEGFEREGTGHKVGVVLQRQKRIKLCNNSSLAFMFRHTLFYALVCVGPGMRLKLILHVVCMCRLYRRTHMHGLKQQSLTRYVAIYWSKLFLLL